MAARPADWPGAGEIDLAVHDLPHVSSSTEWWYVNAHLRTASGRALSMFASFFRVIMGRDPAGLPIYAHSVTWAVSFVDTSRYHGVTRVDRRAPELGLERINRGEGVRDERLRRAMREVLEQGRVPRPDRMFTGEVRVAADRLALDFDGDRFVRTAEGWRVSVADPDGGPRLELLFRGLVPPVRHGDDGVVHGATGEDMFYVFVPRCAVEGVLSDGDTEDTVSGIGWYDHEFGRPDPDERRDERPVDMAWTWCSVQLDDGTSLSAYAMDEEKSLRSRGQNLVRVDADGRSITTPDVRFEPLNRWTSTRTFRSYPTQWRLVGGGVDVRLDASFDDQELVTLISKPAFWEGRCEVSGTVDGRPVTGTGYLERTGYTEVDDLDGFFRAVGQQVRRSIDTFLPAAPTWAELRDLIASPDHDDRMDGVDVDTLTRGLIAPVREITDRGGKSWRSYGALACCDAVGGDSRKFVSWIAFPELMHVGSLIVDDVQDGSTVRRGGPSSHVVHGDALAINAGTACYFLGQRLLVTPDLSAETRVRLYDLYFEALRAGHAGQALDLCGLDDFAAAAFARGDPAGLERRVLAVHRLKTAIPAGTLARMGAVAGGGTDAQVEAMGAFFEAIGLAFQIVDDVLNLRGFKGDLKQRGEDITHGKVTLPVAKAAGLLGPAERALLWAAIASKPHDPAVVAAVIGELESCGAVDACVQQASDLVERGWARLDPLIDDSLPKVMLRAFGWYVLERHY